MVDGAEVPLQLSSNDGVSVQAKSLDGVKVYNEYLKIENSRTSGAPNFYGDLMGLWLALRGATGSTRVQPGNVFMFRGLSCELVSCRAPIHAQHLLSMHSMLLVDLRPEPAIITTQYTNKQHPS
ncbi:hypothetical protein DAPPUDRAFT_247322 [Daphnia pulex]|uniref:Uncharacterized protein n=1 Tax=Daphnia pulex TaxID=6669 RepID=E9GS87_DAPPU|nr:hypothetical protein DAPPUDRAFT_247322 [Daphnia pulex]|eukprot:EFX77713.1 hypothetical protein DAPPUDRAFT_247322 [Daphnia pulex]